MHRSSGAMASSLNSRVRYVRGTKISRARHEGGYRSGINEIVGGLQRSYWIINTFRVSSHSWIWLFRTAIISTIISLHTFLEVSDVSIPFPSSAQLALIPPSSLLYFPTSASETFLVALFFGTGNQTPFIPSTILERVFMDPNMCLCRSRGYEGPDAPRGAKGQAGTTWVRMWSRATQGKANDLQAAVGAEEVDANGEDMVETLDELVLAADADADAALKIFGQHYLQDGSVTPNDAKYTDKRHVTHGITNSKVPHLRPHALAVFIYPRIDTPDPPPLERHVFQRIFLDKGNSRHLWSNDEINPGEGISQKRRKQQSHWSQRYGVTLT
ncbi:hypothetical protein FIBSPDRAFT_932552 [Athelia psychrophila]|uniref:Uncharacterized protein n=1 Tax=Athelia psychrophila TaxID=1759441 RepID=A0A166ILM0_9AGAM|nr:hypothetical protein FIBSPDRAFT_932552 [Fibularhizoctonia sp. CBS 109695]